MEKLPIKQVFLIGNPNAGKTLLFNQLTGLAAKVGNYPGFTVEVKHGHLELPNKQSIELIDLPGTYSLYPRSEDEEIAVKGVLGALAGFDSNNAILAVVDA
ncbi:MAG: ferrous iron transporter B, partial [Methylococcaceae bacterium]|nr:ferrous iron transporter B [Methylococcaceae bacterium]